MSPFSGPRPPPPPRWLATLLIPLNKGSDSGSALASNDTVLTADDKILVSAPLLSFIVEAFKQLFFVSSSSLLRGISSLLCFLCSTKSKDSGALGDVDCLNSVPRRTFPIRD